MKQDQRLFGNPWSTPFACVNLLQWLQPCCPTSAKSPPVVSCCSNFYLLSLFILLPIHSDSAPWVDLVSGAEMPSRGSLDLFISALHSIEPAVHSPVGGGLVFFSLACHTAGCCWYSCTYLWPMGPECNFSWLDTKQECLGQRWIHDQICKEMSWRFPECDGSSSHCLSSE